MSKRTHRRCDARGFSIIEATLAVLLAGGALVAAINVSTAAQRVSGQAADRRYAEQLAHMLMAEVLAQPASGTNTTNGPTPMRLGSFDHVLDYDGLNESPPTTADGVQCAPAGWSWAVSITSRPAEDIDGRMLDLRMYLVTVRVRMPDGTQASLQALRGRTDTVERTPIVDTNAIVQVPVELRMANGTVRRAWPTIRASKTPDGAASRSEVR